MFNYRELPRALEELEPDMIVCNADADVLKGDPLGVLDITPDMKTYSIWSLVTIKFFCMLQGVKKRDQLVLILVRSEEGKFLLSW